MKNIFNHLKVSLIGNDIVRFEYCPNDEFTNQQSLFVNNKQPSEKGLSFGGKNTIYFKVLGFVFSFNEENPFETLKVTKDNVQVYKYKKIKNTGELPTPDKTPVIFPLMDSPRLLLPADGYVKNNSGFILQKDVKDLYLLICDKNYKKLRRQFIQLTGLNEMPKLKTFGLFSSRYYKYTQQTAMDMIQEYQKHGIPLDTFILDTDWRKAEDLEGCGYTINTDLFPNINDFFRYAHRHNIDVMMNDHPLPLAKGNTVFSEDEVEYRNKNLTKLLNAGLDGWWYDRNWSSSLNSVSKDIRPESLGNYIFHNISEQFNSGFVLDPNSRYRDLVMSNINNIKNGEYEKMVDSRSHCYAIQWSGDIFSNEQALRDEIINLNKCSNNMLGYYSSDIGGHEGNPNKNQFIRWIEYGAFSPIMRTHCTCRVKRFREPWNYDEETVNIFRNYVNIRYRLLNSFYTSASKNIRNGLGVCSPLNLLYPEDRKCYKEQTSYIINNNILVAPITDTEKPKSITTGENCKKIVLKITPLDHVENSTCYEEEIDSVHNFSKFYNKVKSLNKKTKKFAFKFEGVLSMKSDYELMLKYCPDTKVTINKKVVFDNVFNAKTLMEIEHLAKGKKYKFLIETIQGRKAKSVDLLYYRVCKNKKTSIYLPEGEWFNVFHKNVYQGKRYLKERYNIDETPVFVKAGSLLAMYKKVDNISKMTLKNVVYDYYTSKKTEVKDYFYEDDGKTMEYTIGEYRKNHYHTCFKDDRYIIELTGSTKLIDDGITEREAIFKAHIRDGEIVENVLLNGQPVRFKRHDHSKKAIPFMDNEFARDSKTVTFKFKQPIKANCKIEIVIRK